MPVLRLPAMAGLPSPRALLLAPAPSASGGGAAAAGSAAPAAAPAADGALVQTLSGPVQGQLARDGLSLSWLGIPYAAPPVGALRWKAPRPHAPWSTPLAATAYGSPGMQVGSVYGPPAPGKNWGLDNIGTFGKPVGSEDCLSLNLWRPHHGRRDLPVLVFVHGGSNIAGYSGDPIYDGARLAVAADALVVTVNYRLGLFGWFTHPALQEGEARDDSGNYGTLDLIQALRFVQDNAAAFGGDPGNVTLAGQSAGAINTYSLMAAPAAAGLFHKAMLFSGLINSTPREQGYAYAQRLATALVVRDGLAADDAAATRYIAARGAPWLGPYLRGQDAAGLLELVQRVPALRRPPNVFGDGVVLPADLRKAFDEGRCQRMPVIAGITRDEARLFTAGVIKVSDAQRFTMMLGTDADAAPAIGLDALIKPWLLPALGPWLYGAYARLIMAVALRQVNRSIARLAHQPMPVYAYRFDWNRGPEPWRTLYGAAHGIDLPFLFGNFAGNFFAMDFSTANRPGREALSQLLMGSVAGFMRSGDPNVPGMGVQWRPWSADGARPGLVFDATDEATAVSTR